VLERRKGGLLVGCMVDGSGGGYFLRYDGYLDGSGNSIRAAKAFVSEMLAGAPEEQRVPLPAFPPPDIPRKQASTSLAELTYDNLPLKCFGGPKSVCVLALLPEADCPEAIQELARRHRNDPVSFVFLPKAVTQTEFVEGFGLSLSELPKLVAVRAGKRSRFAVLDGGLEAEAMGRFVDRILGGDMVFQKLKELPELEPPYLQRSASDEDASDEDKEEL